MDEMLARDVMISNLPDRKKLRRLFNRSAMTFHQASQFHDEIGQRLLDRLNFIRIQPDLIVDVGVGTGQFAHQLSLRYPQARVMGLDMAKKRLLEAQKKHTQFYSICAEADQLPLKNQSVDFIWSNLTFHWCIELLPVFQEMRRILRPQGSFLFSMLGKDTLQEIRSGYEGVDQVAPVYHFLDMHQVGDALLQAGFQDPVVDMEHITVLYPDVTQFFKNLKASGATYLSFGEGMGLRSPVCYKKIMDVLTEQYQEKEGVSITFEVIYGYAMSQFAISEPM